MTVISDYIEIHKSTIVSTICFTIMAICIAVIVTLTLPKRYTKELVEISSVCDTDPQKADSLLELYQQSDKGMDDDDKWYCRFITLKSEVKQYADITDDKEAAAILRHFEEEDDEETLQQVYYYVGCAYHILGNAPHAIGLLQKGLSITPQTKETEQLRALYYYMLGGIYTYQYLNKEALGMQLKALALHKKLNDRKRVIYDCISLSWTYKALGNLDKALSYLAKAKTLTMQTTPNGKLAEIEAQIADAYYGKAEYEKARTHIELALKEEDLSDRNAIYSIAAHIYEALGENKYATHYYRQLMKDGTIFNRQSAYKYIAKQCKEHGDLGKAYTYCMLYANTTDTITQENASEYSARANAAFNYKHIEKENEALRSTSTHKDVLIYVSIVILGCAIGYHVFFRHKTRQRQRELHVLLMEMRRQNGEAIENNKKELQDIRRKLKSMEAEKTDIEQKYKSKERQLQKTLQETLLLKQISESNDRIWFATEPYKTLKRIYDNGETVSENDIDWSIFEQTLFNIYPSFKENLSKLKKMKEQSYHVCLLIKAGFSVNQISFFTNRSQEAIISTRRRLYESNFGIKGKPSEWDDFIKSM